jgi:hypothetical protein
MSANELGSLHDLGVSATLHNNCPPLLASLDLSNNELSMVELETLLSWPSITSLNLGSNYIRLSRTACWPTPPPWSPST